METIPVTEDVAELLDELEPFYEVVEDEDDEVTSRPPVLAIGALLPSICLIKPVGTSLSFQIVGFNSGSLREG